MTSVEKNLFKEYGSGSASKSKIISGNGMHNLFDCDKLCICLLMRNNIR